MVWDHKEDHSLDYSDLCFQSNVSGFQHTALFSLRQKCQHLFSIRPYFGQEDHMKLSCFHLKCQDHADHILESFPITAEVSLILTLQIKPGEE